MAGRRIVKNWKWRLGSTPEALWPIVSDTRRLNEALGMPRYRLRETIDENGLRRRFGEYDTDTQRVRWEEPCYEWAAPHWWRWQRIYEDGPLEYARATLQLEPGKSGGTTALYTLEADPRDFAGSMLVRFGHLNAAARDLERVLRRADAHCRKPAGDFYANLFAQRERGKRPLPNASALLATAPERERETLKALLSWAAVAPETDIDELRPRRFARALGLSLGEAFSLCRVATELGLLEVRYRLTCATCGRICSEDARIGGIAPAVACRHCGAHNERSLAENVDVAFRTTPLLRPPALGTSCASGPSTARTALLQQTLDPHERRELPMQLAMRRYQARIRDVAEPVPFLMPGRGGILIKAGTDWIDAPESAGNVVLENHAEHELTFVIETAGGDAEASSWAELALSRRWYAALDGECAGLEESEAIGEVALLAVGSSSATLTNIADVVAEETGGCVCETMRGGVVLCFADPANAAHAVESLRTRVAKPLIGGDFGSASLTWNQDRPSIEGEPRERALRLRDRAEPGAPLFSPELQARFLPEN